MIEAVKGKPDFIMVPKIESREDIMLVEKTLRSLERLYNVKEGSIKLISLVETPRAILRLDEIVEASPGNP